MFPGVKQPHTTAEGVALPRLRAGTLSLLAVSQTLTHSTPPVRQAQGPESRGTQGHPEPVERMSPSNGSLSNPSNGRQHRPVPWPGAIIRVQNSASSASLKREIWRCSSGQPHFASHRKPGQPGIRRLLPPVRPSGGEGESPNAAPRQPKGRGAILSRPPEGRSLPVGS
jgi:hypothetical protein